MYVIGEWCLHQNCLCFLSKQHLAFLTDISLLSPSLLQHGWELSESSISKPILQLRPSPAVFTKYFHISYKYLLLIICMQNSFRFQIELNFRSGTLGGWKSCQWANTWSGVRRWKSSASHVFFVLCRCRTNWICGLVTEGYICKVKLLIIKSFANEVYYSMYVLMWCICVHCHKLFETVDLFKMLLALFKRINTIIFFLLGNGNWHDK